MTHTERAKAAGALLLQLEEFFDAVQILGSFLDEDGNTSMFKAGRGNWYARTGMAREFLAGDQAEVMSVELAKQLPHDDDDSEGWRE